MSAPPAPWESWDLLADAAAREQGTPRAHAAERAIGVMRSVLGEDWLNVDPGHIPQEIAFAFSHTLAFVRLLELALRLQEYADAPGAAVLRRNLKTDRRPDSWVSVATISSLRSNVASGTSASTNRSAARDTWWDPEQLAEGRAVLDRALALRGRGQYVIQAAIGSLHAEEVRDWEEIAALYRELVRLTGSPVAELNRAIAVSECDGPDAGLAIVDSLELGDYQYLHSTRGELLRRLGRIDEARTAFARAIELAGTEPERRRLRRRLAELA